MDRSDVLTLIKQQYTPNEFGAQQATETTRDVFCNVDSVTIDEIQRGGLIGLNPEYRFTMFRYDYEDEEVCEYNGTRYRIYRTYFGKNDTIELYAERRKGDG